MGTEQRTSHVKTLLAVVVSVVFSDDTDACFDQLVGHISQEEGLLKSTVALGADMR